MCDRRAARRLIITVVIMLTGTRLHAEDAPPDDPFVFLEEIDSPQALGWVRAHNQPAQERLGHDRRYEATSAALRRVLLAHDRLPDVRLRGQWLYNFWQDETHVRGLWRRTTIAEYRRKKPRWDVLLDIDALAQKESENWVYAGVQCLPPANERCLVSLSRGGKDASVVREFDLATRAFVPSGFLLSEAKSDVSWIDGEHLLVGTDFGPGSLTSSGYPRLIKLWRRGTPLAQAETVFEARSTDVAASSTTMFAPEGNVTLLVRTPSFFEQESYVFEAGRPPQRIPFPRDAQLAGFFSGRYLAQLRSAWAPSGTTFPSGSIVALPADALDDPARAALVLAPAEHRSIQGVAVGHGALYASLLEDVKGRVALLRAEKDGTWSAHLQPFPDHSAVSIVSADAFADTILVQCESFLEPSTLYMLAAPGAPSVLRRAPRRFASRSFEVVQYFAKSADGTSVPYFLVRRTKAAHDPAPTLLYGYGGFEVSMEPNYLDTLGGTWLEKGGIYVLANIRGGGEYGPAWHQAALKENRGKAFDDFIAVAEDLLARKITTPRRLGIMGGSNGGLLVGATAIRRPELFAAVVCQVPLLDMLRYTKLAAGASWIGEYGDPDDPHDRAFLRRYSPYHNVDRASAYPEIFFVTSTADDRVHPGHARKMAAQLLALGHPVLYFENIEGGHGSAANLEQETRRRALETVYLYQKLMDPR